MLTAHALLLFEKYNTQDHLKPMVELINNLMERKDTAVNLYLAISLGSWIPVSKEVFLPILARLSQIYSGSAVYQEAVVSSLKDLERIFRCSSINRILTQV
jgi:hypothetical protein